MKNSKNLGLFGRTGKLQRLFLIALFSVLAIGAYAQSKTVSGTVVDQTGEPIIGANVVVKGTTNGIITDLDGRFTLSNVPDKGTISISFIGYQDQEISVAGKTNLQVTLQEDNAMLDEVVVVGYGVQKKSDVTGAMARVGEKELKAMPVKNALEGMQGKTAGVDITSSQRPGEVGGINIRGVRSIDAEQGPLYVVDGMIIQTGGIENINPSDIEAIDILKDASATAIYGSRGANGVILVTTKKGKQGKVTLNYSGTVTFETLHDVTEMMSAAEWLDYARTAKYNMGSYASATPDYTADKAIFGSVAASWANIEQAWSNGTYDASKVGSYDWAANGKQTGITHEHTLSASGGSEKFQGYASFGYLNQKGTQPGQAYERYTLKTSFDINPIDFFKMGTSINASYSDQDYGYNFSKSVTGSGDLYNALRSMLPWTVPYDSNGDYIRNPNGDVNIINPIRELDYNTNQRRTFRANASMYAQVDFGKIWEPLEGLSYRLQFGPEFQYYTLGIANAAGGINGDGNNGAQYKNEQKRSWTLDNLIYYNKRFAEHHNLGLTLMQSASAYHYEMGDMRATNVASADELWYNLGTAGTLSSFGTGLTETQMASYMVRVNYGFKDKYLLTASMRWDGASQLAPGHKWASFPSAALAWRIDQEDFMKDINWLSQLKLRFGVGVTGNAAIDAYATLGGLKKSVYTFGSSVYGYYPSEIANKDLTWEKTSTWNLGLDFSILRNRISGTIDTYISQTSDLLLPSLLPSSTGYASVMQNIGKTENKGIEVTLNTIWFQNKNFSWNTDWTYSLNREKIKALNSGVTRDEGNLWFVGSPTQVFYDYKKIGIWQLGEEAQAKAFGGFKPGDIKVADMSPKGSEGEGVFSTDDRVIFSRVPKYTFGITNNITYKNFDLMFFIYGRIGQYVKDAYTQLYKPSALENSAPVNYWTPENPSNEYPRPNSGYSTNSYLLQSSLAFRKASFVKIRDITLGYTLPKEWTSKMMVQKLRIYCSLNNFITFTDFPNYDPESNGSMDFPLAKQVLFGINLSL